MALPDDRRFMETALALAEKGRGLVSPNPMVGAVVVKDGAVIGSGWHRKAGGPHAEVFAIGEAGEAAKGATLYVTLEPCCHYGKTPPCTELIIRSGITRVVAAMRDENPLVCGNGCAELAKAGVVTETGLMENEARRLNEAFIKHIRTKMPFVTLKLASTLDGCIADKEGRSAWITGPEARKLVHRWRSWSDAVLVGAGTVLVDNPSLTVRDVEGRNPLRVVVDSSLRTKPDAKVIGDGNCIVAVTGVARDEDVSAVEKAGAAVWRFNGVMGRVPLEKLLARLGEERQVTSVLCEGGGALAGALFDGGLVDKVVFMYAPKIFGGGIRSVAGSEPRPIAEAVTLADVEMERIGDDTVVTGYPVYLTNE